MIFATERLVVREWSENDLEDAFEIYSDPEVMRYLGASPAPIPDREKMLERMRFWKERDRDLAPGLGFWAITLVGKPIGSVILRPLPHDTRVEVGWHLGRRFWGAGYASEAARGAIECGFGPAGLDEIYSIIYPENLRSVRVAERLGMESLGITKKYHDLELLLYRTTRPCPRN